MTRSRKPDDVIRVLMVMPSYYPVVGGMEIQVERQIPYLREHGIDVTVLTRQTSGSVKREVRDGTEIRRIVVPGRPGLKSVSFTALGSMDVVRHRTSIDLIHAHSIMSPTTVAALTGTFLRKPVVVTLHARYEPERLLSKPLGRQRLGLYRRIIDRFISINGDIDQLLSDHSVPRSRVASIPNGIDTSVFRPADVDTKAALLESLGLPHGEPVALFVGRLLPIKQVDVLLRAWANVDPGRLVILGDGPEATSLGKLTSELGLSDRVTFKGMVTNVVDYLRAADVFVLPSSTEGLSVALLEAMSAGLLPVATAVGGAVDLIRDGESGLLVESGDVAGLTQALQRAISDIDWRTLAASRARETVIETYDMGSVAASLASLYREVHATHQ